MKQKYVLKDNNGKVVYEKEIKVRDREHFECQLKGPKNYYENKYSRKEKHKNKSYDF